MSEAELRAFLQPDETALELLARTVSEPVQTGIWFLGALRPGQVLEITGQSGSAKTETLIQIAVHCVLPEEAQGRAESVVLLDLDAKFDALRLIQVLSARIQSAQRDLDSDVELRAALRRFHLVQCCSSFEVLAALETLPALMERLQGDGKLQLLLLDNMAAHYWVDKARHATPGQRSSCAAMTLHAVHAAIAGKLQQILRKYRCAAVATVHAVLGSGPGSHSSSAAGPGTVQGGADDALWNVRDFLPQPWQAVVTHRVLLRLLQPSSDVVADAVFGAKWRKPAHDAVYGFHVAEDGLGPTRTNS